MTSPIKHNELYKWFKSKRKEIIIPNFQRDFEWNKKKIENLFDSINRGYFIGMFYMWNFSKNDTFRKQFKKLGYWNLPIDYKKGEEKERNADATYAVLDGQQRLSALNIGLYGSFEGEVLYFNTKKGIFQFKSKNYGDANPEWKKVSDIRKDIDDHKQTKNKLETSFKNNFRRATMAYFQVDGELDKVTEIFKRINITGTRLSPNYVLLAELMSKGQGKEFRMKLENLRREFTNQYKISIDYSFIVQAALLLTGKSLKKKNFSQEDLGDIKQNWDRIENSILKMGKYVHKEAGFSDANISSLNALLPIAYIIYNHNEKECQDPMLIKRYLYSSFFKKIFARATDAMLTKIRKLLDDNGYSIKKLLRTRDMFKINLDDILKFDYSKQSKYAFMALCILYAHRLKSKDSLHMDHMHPQKFFDTPQKLIKQLEKEKASAKTIRSFKKNFEHYKIILNSLPNLELLEKAPNQKKNDTSLKEWIMEKLPQRHQIFDYERNFINKGVPLELKNFKKFVDFRKEKMRKALDKFFKGQQFDII